jgi:hypothetical protein
MIMSGCASGNTTHARFSDDVNYIEQHADVVVLRDGAARVAVSPKLMGRVMTVSFAGDGGPSLGFIHKDNIAKGDDDPVFNNYGGVDRFWLGPEGGQFSLYFPPGQPQELAHWKVPAGIDKGGMAVREQSTQRVSFRRDMAFTNFSGQEIKLQAERVVALVSVDSAEDMARIDLSGCDYVGYETINRVTNTGESALDRETGAVSIWILGMFVPSAKTVVIAPFKTGGQGTFVNDEYFGKVPPDRLKILEEASVILFKTDSQARSKIGLSPRRAKPVMGSIDFENEILTICTFTIPENASEYVNSMWDPKQDKPFGGDVSNSYNDDGKMGTFFEIETSSPALFLNPGESATHVHRTLHIHAPLERLEQISSEVFGVSLAAVKAAMF